MKLLSYRYFEGPNVHCLRPVAEAEVDLESHAQFRTDQSPDFQDRLVGWLPGLSDHHCSLGYAGGFVRRLREGTFLGHVVEHVSLELLASVGEQVYWGKTRYRAETVVMVVFESETRPGGLAALQEAIRAVSGLADDPNWQWDGLGALRDRLAQWRVGPSTRAIIDAARRRDIPVTRLDQDSLVRLGQGVHQVMIAASLTGRTPAIGVDLAQDKAATKARLAAAGIPVADGRLVRTEADAVEALHDFGAVTLKPVHGNHGRGVHTGLTEERAVREAFSAASRLDSEVLAETHLEGRCVRLLVVGDKMAAAAERVPPAVTGDGVRTVAALIEDLNRDPRRGDGHDFPMTRVVPDDDVHLQLARQGLDLQSVPAPGQTVVLRAVANLSAGATARDVTDEIGADLAQDAVRAAQALGLDVAGIDVISPKLDVGLAEAGGAVLEVNAAPGLRMHETPAEGTPRRVGQAIVDWLFPPGQTGRIPVTAVTGTNGKTTVVRMLAGIWTEAGYRTGMATTDGIWIGDRQVVRGDLTGPWSARLVLGDATVEAAVLETARGGIARGGLGFNDCDVAVVTNIGSDHLGQDGIRDLDDLVHLKSLIVDVVRPRGAAVLNADDPRVMGMTGRTRGRIVVFSARPDSLGVIRALREGRSAVFLRRGYLVWATPEQEVRLTSVRSLPASLNGIAHINVANAAAAAAAALAAGLPPRVVARALTQFPPGGHGVNRGRLEVVQGPDLTILIDYGHNAPALSALAEVCRGLRARHVVTVLGLPGDRRNEDLAATAATAARFSSHMVIREDADRRGRQPGEVAAILEQAVLEAGIARQHVETVLDEGDAVRKAVREAPPGSLVVVLYERYRVVKEACEQALSERSEAATANSRVVTGIP
jgi:cyanophycin synthetase